MMQNTAWVFQIRWFLRGLGILYLLVWVAQVRFGFFGDLPERFKNFSDRYFRQIIWGVSGTFFLLAGVAKFSQLVSMSLNAQDFWLFVDILEQMKKGGVFLTRFAPQDLGFIQHGIVHPMLSWCILFPFVWLFGSVPVALVVGPAALSLAGLLLAQITRFHWGARGAIFWMSAFFASTQVGKVLMYDVHPEVMYPVFILLWMWAIGLDGSGKIRWAVLVMSTFLTMGVKEDSFLILGPWILWGVIYFKKDQRKAAGVSAFVAVGIVLLQMRLVHDWRSGVLGPGHWEGLPVSLNVGLGLLKGRYWSNLHEAGEILGQLLANEGGCWGILKKILGFWVSRSWISLLVFAPFVLLLPLFWWVTLPLACIYSLFDARYLWNYYSAPFLASFWFCAAWVGVRWKRKRWIPIWALGASLLLGSGSIQILFPSAQVMQIRNETQSLLPCIDGRVGARGLVASHLLGLVPLNFVLTDRIPRNERLWDQMDFVLFSPGVDRFELPIKQAQGLYRDLAERRNWHQVGKGCQVIPSADLSGKESHPQVVLFLRL